MDTTTESGTWSQADSNGYYWWRFDKDDTPQPVDVRDGFFYSVADRSPTSVSFGEFLGPLSPADTEQLVQLQRAIVTAIENLESDHVTPNLHRMGLLGKSDVESAINELRAALETRERNTI